MHKSILRLAIPNILSNLSVPLLGMVDTAMMGRMDEPVYLGAIALGSVIFSFLYWGFGFLRMGTTGLTAQAYGRGDHKETFMVLNRGLVIAGVGSIILIFSQLGIEYVSLRLLEASQEVEALTRSYFRIRIYAAPATIGLYAFHGWFLGMQNARYPMWLTLLVNICNICFNAVLVYEWEMKSDGVAWGTVLAQYVGLIAAILMFRHTYSMYLRYRDWSTLWRGPAIRNFFRVNADIFVRTMCLIFAFTYFTAASATLGENILAVNQILLQYFYLMSYGVDGFAFAAESLVGKYTGEGDRHKLVRVVKTLFVWGIGLGLLFSLSYLLIGESMLYVFTDQQTLIQAAQPYLFWLILIPFMGAIAFMWDGVYMGAIATRSMRNTMLVATIIVFLPVSYWGIKTASNHLLWLAMALLMASRALLLSAIAKRVIFRLS